MHLSRRLVLTVPFIAACTPMPAPESAVLPRSALPQSPTDPTRGAIFTASDAFGRIGGLQGDPAAAATALGQLEFLTVELGFGPTWRDLDPLVAVHLREARAEARGTLGFRAEAPAQVAVDALFGTAEALRAQDQAAARAALAPLVLPGSADAVLARLAALPPLPRATFATAQARGALSRRDREGNRGNRIF